MNIDIALLQDGLVVMSVGFSIVFAFLTILIIAMIIMHHVVGFVNKLFPVAAPVTVQTKTSSSGDDEIAVAIAAALMKMNS